MRHHYLQSFQYLFIDNLNGDKYRNGKTTPEGLPDPSAFSTPHNREGIQVGTAIATLVRDGSRTNSFLYLRNLWGVGKLTQLERESRHEAEPIYESLITAPELGNPFAHRTYTAAFTTWPRLNELFPFYSPGLTTSTDALVVDIDEEKLVERMRIYFSKEVDTVELASHVPAAVAKRKNFNIAAVRSKLQERASDGGMFNGICIGHSICVGYIGNKVSD